MEQGAPRDFLRGGARAPLLGWESSSPRELMTPSNGEMLIRRDLTPTRRESTFWEEGGALTSISVAAKLRKMQQICNEAAKKEAPADWRPPPGFLSRSGPGSARPSPANRGPSPRRAFEDLRPSVGQAAESKAPGVAPAAESKALARPSTSPTSPSRPLSVPIVNLPPKPATPQAQSPPTSTPGPSSRRPNRGDSPRSIINTTNGEDFDIVQCSAPLYFVEEEEGVCLVDIMRLGSMKGMCSINWETVEDSAKAGERYESGKGKVTFQEGEHTKTIKIKILDDDSFATTLELKVKLTRPVNCELGRYLHTSRIKIIDKDLFPSSLFRKQIEEGLHSIEQIPQAGLMWEYFKLNFWHPGMQKRTFTFMLLCQLSNLNVLLALILNQYMVDVLFSAAPGIEARLLLPTRQATAYVVGLLWIVPMAVLTFADMVKVRLDVAGRSKRFVQENLFRKYLHYTDDSRALVSDSSIQVALTKDCAEVVEGYMQILGLATVLGKLAVILSFILSENPEAVTDIVLMTSCMLVFVCVSSHKVTELAEKATVKATKLVAITNETCHKYSLICEYMQRPQMVDIFASAGAKAHTADINAQLYRTLTDYFPKWLGPVFIGGYIMLKAEAVFDGSLSLGTLLATIRIYHELEAELGVSYGTLMKLAASVGPLRKLTWLFNLPTDVRQRKIINRRKRELTKQAREKLLSAARSDSKSTEEVLKPLSTRSKLSNATSVGSVAGWSVDIDPVAVRDAVKTGIKFKTDLIPIQCINLAFTFPGADKPLLSNVNIAVPQGKVIAVVGGHGSGKTTFLKMLAGMLFPTEGIVFIPGHLRVLQVSHEPSILDLPVLRNLCFGAPDENIERIKQVLERLNMQQTLTMVEAEVQKAKDRKGGPPAWQEEGGRWQHSLNYVEKAKIHLARALIMNPEVLVLHRPLVHYDENSLVNAREVLREQVKNNGVCLDTASAWRRRPRTCIYTPSSALEMEDADVVWLCTEGNVIEVPKLNFKWDQIPE